MARRSVSFWGDMGISLEAVRTFPYAGRTIRAGHLFQAANQDQANLLIRIKLARVPVRSKRIEPDPEPEAPEDETLSIPARRQYRRKTAVVEAE